ncbi:putative protein kinase RLK-Pelle-WAK family [Helianthus debilis subsp. tardiflorus]
MGEKNMLLHFILFLFIFPLIMAMEVFPGATTNNTAKPGCQTECGNVTVPFPFGIGTDCSLSRSLYLTCNTSYETPKLFLQNGNLQVYNISDTELRVYTTIAYRCYNQSGVADEDIGWTNLAGLYTFSAKNKFTVVGCDDYSLIRGTNGGDFSSGCFGLCSKARDVPHGECSGIGCCQTSIPKGLSYYNITLGAFHNHSNVLSFNECGYGFLVEEGSFEFGGVNDLSTDYRGFAKRIRSTMPVVLDWVIRPNGTCANEVDECKGNSSCHDVEGGGYRCKCNEGYDGNPYLHPGCQDIDECHDKGENPCYGICINTLGSYNCTCHPGSIGDANILNGCEEVSKHSKNTSTMIIIVIVSSMLAILLGIVMICFGIRRRKLIRLREKFFEQNGGVLLKQKIKSQGSHEAMTLFSTEQLRKATNNYSEEKIIGKGAYGVVYKGVLLDKRVVAIKKSKLVDTTQADQFINEVMILTQVIHRNVVKLLGCCLEEEVPVLVYEFISNNTLFHHIHHKLGGMNWLSWENRLRLATEAASALGYLHSETSMPIIHRDVKSSNILIDENYTAKISDFGASRLVPLDHQQVTTLIQGTLGYLDPEYFNSSQLTEKSDVYSFGVVLAELITGTLDQLQAAGDLVKRCLSLVGLDRPTMKEVAVELQNLRKFTTHHWAQQQTYNETRSLVLEVEQSDLYDVPLVSGNSEWESYSGIGP